MVAELETQKMTPRLFEFTFWLAPEGRELLDWANALYEAGADDSSPGTDCGAPYVTFHREADSFEAAVRSAHRDIQAAGCRVLRCEIAAEEMAIWAGAK
jgi:hypothetical protein